MILICMMIQALNTQRNRLCQQSTKERYGNLPIKISLISLSLMFGLILFSVN